MVVHHLLAEHRCNRPNVSDLGAARPSSGFTLIELLIVVAIIAIFAAIAVPNFLEAQVRSKVSRMQADLRSMAVAVESYVVDHNTYPDNFNAVTQLTTPIAYFSTSYINDPFSLSNLPPESRVYGFLNFEAAPLDVAMPAWVPDAADRARLREVRWIVGGRGPDQQLCSQAAPDDIAYWEISLYCSRMLSGEGVYDPTNGTISYGDVARSRQGVVDRPLGF